MHYFKPVVAAALVAMSSTMVLAQSSTTPDTAAPASTEPAKPAETKDAALVQTPGDVATSKLVGSTVHNTTNETIGEVDDVIIAPSGSVTAVIIGVGGFLGVNEKKVAMPYSALKVERSDNKGLKITVEGTKDSLKAMPEFKYADS